MDIKKINSYTEWVNESTRNFDVVLLHTNNDERIYVRLDDIDDLLKGKDVKVTYDVPGRDPHTRYSFNIKYIKESEDEIKQEVEYVQSYNAELDKVYNGHELRNRLDKLKYKKFKGNILIVVDDIHDSLTFSRYLEFVSTFKDLKIQIVPSDMMDYTVIQNWGDLRINTSI